MVPHRSLRRVVAALTAAVALATVVPASPASAATPRPAVLVSRLGGAAVAEPAYRPLNRTAPQSLSADGRYVAFATDSGPSTDVNGGADVYVRDRRTGTSEAISVTPAGRAGSASSRSPSISGDGRYVAFASEADDLVAGDSGISPDAFVRDRSAGTTRRANLHGGGERTGDVFQVQISADGGTVMWTSTTGVYTRDLPSGTIGQLSADPTTVASLSGNGEYVAYARFDGSTPVHRIRLADGAVDVVSTSTGGAVRNGSDPQISATGIVVSFVSDATDITSTPPTGTSRLYARDLTPGSGARLRIVDATVDAHTMSGSAYRFAFTTSAALAAADTDAAPDVYVAAALSGAPVLVSDAHSPSPPEPGRTPSYSELSGDGLVVSVTSSTTTGTGTTFGAPRVFALATESVDAGLTVVSEWFPRLFARSMTTGEAATRRGQIAALARTGAEVVVDDVRRESFSGTRAGVVRLYQAYFLRRPDTAGYDHWVGRRQAGVSLDAISRAFAASPEFTTLYGSLDDRRFVQLVYQNVLGRPADAAGADYWTAQLASGARNRGQVMTGFSEAPENRTRTALVVETIMLHRAFNGSVPSATYLAGTRARGAGGLGLTAELAWIAD